MRIPAEKATIRGDNREAVVLFFRRAVFLLLVRLLSVLLKSLARDVARFERPFWNWVNFFWKVFLNLELRFFTEVRDFGEVRYFLVDLPEPNLPEPVVPDADLRPVF